MLTARLPLPYLAITVSESQPLSTYIATTSNDTSLSPPLPPLAMAGYTQEQTPSVISFKTNPNP